MTSEIWIVDDEPGILAMCSDYLSDSYTVRTFLSPLQVLVNIENQIKPDLILTDVKMPELDGLQLTEALHGFTPQLPVLMMSGYADKTHILNALAKGVLGFVEKPFNPMHMKRMIDETIGKKHYIHTLENLAVKYNSLTSAVFELNQEYISRYIAAENQLYELKAPLAGNLAEARRTLENIKRSNQLNHAVRMRTHEINEILSQENDLLERLSLISEPAVGLRQIKGRAT